MENCAFFMKSLDDLSHLVYIWPPLSQINTVHMKWPQACNLLHVARNCTFTMRPQTRLLEDGQQFPSSIILKRTHSDTSHHVLLPGDSRHTCDYMRANCEVPGSKWFGQTYVEPLVKLGEWRVHMVGGQVIYTVHTICNRETKTWKWDVATKFYSLEELV
jgi:hypothetical protein